MSEGNWQGKNALLNKSNVLLNKPNAAVIIVKNEIGEIRSNSGKCKYVSFGADQAVEKYFNHNDTCGGNCCTAGDVFR